MPNVVETLSAPYPLKLLLLDTCGSEATVAVAEGGEVLQQVRLPGRSASEGLVSAIGDVLRERGWRLQDLDALAVVRGPGSFTGVRVGVSAAKALAEASGRPLIAVSRLEVLAMKAPGAAIAVLDAGRGEVFWAPVLADGIGEQAVASRMWVAEQARALGLPLVGEFRGHPELAEGEVQEVTALTAADGLPLVSRRLRLGQTDDPLLLDALYLHRTEQETLDRQRNHQAMKVRAVPRS